MGLAEQVLHVNCPDILTLDRRRLTGKGIVSGSSFRVPPLAEAAYRFGSALPRVSHAEAEEHEAAMSALVQAFHALEAQDDALLAAQQVRDMFR